MQVGGLHSTEMLLVFLSIMKNDVMFPPFLFSKGQKKVTYKLKL